jgi:hypothetical protein
VSADLSNSTGPVSGPVVASVATGGNRLALLVLWQLAPALKGAGDGTRGELTTRFVGQQLSFGAATVSLRLDRQMNMAYVGNEPIALVETNVVLAEIDDQGRATITERMRVNAELPNGDGDHFREAVIRREPVRRDFLRCDQHFPDHETMCLDAERTLDD